MKTITENPPLGVMFVELSPCKVCNEFQHVLPVVNVTVYLLTNIHISENQTHLKR